MQIQRRKIAIISGTAVSCISAMILACSFTPPSYADCWTIVDRGFDKNCDKNFHVHWRNSCTQQMDIQWAFETETGKWYVGSDYDVAPGDLAKGSKCEATGKYQIWSRPSTMKKEIRFPKQEELNEKK